MTRQELCSLLGVPAEVSATDLLKGWTTRLAALRDQLQQEGLPKPVKIMCTREVADLESAAAGGLASQLEQIAKAEMLLASINDELAKAGWTRGVVELLCRKLEPLVPAIPEENERLKFERRLIEIAEKVMTQVPPPAPAPPPVAASPTKPPYEGSTPPHDVPTRLEAYFSEITAERAKPAPARGVIRLWLQKIGALIEMLPDESTRLGYEKRVVSIEYWLEGSQPPWARPAGNRPPSNPPVAPPPAPPVTPPPAAQPAPPPAAPGKPPTKPAPGTLLQLLPKAADGTLRRSGPPIHFVARPRFVLGRQRSKADFVTWFLPASPANQQKTDSISRVNTTLFVKTGQLWIQDGEITEDGKPKPSAGTVVDGQALTPTPVQLNFTKERNLKLGQSAYELKAVHLPAVAPEGPAAAPGAIDNTSSQATVRLPVGPFGCLRLQSVSSREVEILAVWLLSEATLGADPGSAVMLDGAGLPPAALRIHHWAQGFWLVVPGSGRSKVTLDGQALAGGDVRPLQSAHQLGLGTLHFDLKVSA